MFVFEKWRLPAAAAMLVLLAAACVAAAEDEKPRVSDSELESWVDERIEKFQPNAAERRFDEIGWETEILAAEELAREHGRPVFLFTHDGRMAIGRC